MKMTCHDLPPLLSQNHSWDDFSYRPNTLFLQDGFVLAVCTRVQKLNLLLYTHSSYAALPASVSASHPIQPKSFHLLQYPVAVASKTAHTPILPVPALQAAVPHQTCYSQPSFCSLPFSQVPTGKKAFNQYFQMHWHSPFLSFYFKVLSTKITLIKIEGR